MWKFDVMEGASSNIEWIVANMRRVNSSPGVTSCQLVRRSQSFIPGIVLFLFAIASELRALGLSQPLTYLCSGLGTLQTMISDYSADNKIQTLLGFWAEGDAPPT